MKVCEIGDRMDGVHVEGKITYKSEPETIQTRYGWALYAQAVLEDETGSIRLDLWRDQARAANVGDTVRIENGFTQSGKLAVGSKGAVIVVPQSRKSA